MVWIHGGGFVIGSGSDTLTDGTNLASRGVVAVTINYRLGAFGFLSHPSLSAESAHGASGNYGLLDMVAALEWVRDNAATFGGDPDRVTIFGESAGGGAVMSVMLMPQSQGLFHRAIAESPYINGWDRRLSESFGGSTSAEAQGVTVGEALEATGDNALAAMRAASPEEVFEAVGAAGLVWAPNVDGWSIPVDPIEMYASGQQHHVPLITGMNGNEGSLMTGQLQMDDVAAFEAHVRTSYLSVADQAIAHYAVSSPEEAKPGVDHLLHDMWFAGPVRTLSTHHVKAPSPVWVYHFTLVPPTGMGANLGSHHAAEITYVFGNLIDRGSQSEDAPAHPMLVGDWTDVDRGVSTAMMDYWTQFAATGNPNREGLTEWPEFDESDQHMTFSDPLEVGTGLHVAGADLYTAYNTQRRASGASE